MIKGLEAVLLSSDNPRRLAEFYKNKVGLKLTMEMEIGENGEEGFSFEMPGSANLYILHHSKVKGKNTTPERIMINFEVDTIEKDVKRLQKAGVTLIQEIYHVEDYGKIATFKDIDGNFFQLVQVREV